MIPQNINFNRFPSIEVKGFENECSIGWDKIYSRIAQEYSAHNAKNYLIVFDCYIGLHDDEIIQSINKYLKPDKLFLTFDAMKSVTQIEEMTYQDVTDDEIFGYLTRLNISDFFDVQKLNMMSSSIDSVEGLRVIYGPGASIINKNYNMLVYGDMPRWEGQLRFRRDEVSNLGIANKNEEASLQYKRAFFVDWRVLDKHKKKIFKEIDYVLDTVIPNNPKMISGRALLEGLNEATRRPFSLVPFFDPGPWGGQWMKQVCDLNKDEDNYAWCFNCVPEENSLSLKFGKETFETPSINLVFQHPKELLGESVHARFGDEFPIRFDFLDTMQGGNLSLQVHPLTEYIQEKFGFHYTQDESYYLLDAEKDAVVYLGLKEGVNSLTMMEELKNSQETGELFDAKKHIGQWPAKKHDHFLIPAGTVHCSGANSMVLEISATPYIFTFKLYDWGRLGLNGKPRPINIMHGENVIQWDRSENWCKENLINKVEKIAESDGWIEERTGLHEREFIETRRHWFTEIVSHNTNGGVNVLNLVEGEEIIVESPANKFNPFIVKFAETFIVPASVGEYTIRPFGLSEGKKCGTIKAFVRTNP